MYAVDFYPPGSCTTWNLKVKVLAAVNIWKYISRGKKGGLIMVRRGGRDKEYFSVGWLGPEDPRDNTVWEGHDCFFVVQWVIAYSRLLVTRLCVVTKS